MAHVATHDSVQKPGFGIARLFNEIFDFFIRMSEANARVRQVEALNALSDAQLAKRGLRREDIVRHVFQDLYGI